MVNPTDIGHVIRQCECLQTYRKQESPQNGTEPRYYCSILLPQESYRCCYGGKLIGIVIPGRERQNEVGFVQCMYPNVMR
jgi:hypothetical protein